jgi:hypothetical protein
MPTALERALAEVGGLPGAAAAGDPLAARLDNLEVELTTLWVLICAFFVFQVRAIHLCAVYELLRCCVGSAALADGRLWWRRPGALRRPCPSSDPLPHLLAGAACSQMQSGFALLEAGSVRAKNTKNICEPPCRPALPVPFAPPLASRRQLPLLEHRRCGCLHAPAALPSHHPCMQC